VKARTRVLVTEATHNPGLAAVRALARSGFDVIGTDYRDFPFGLKSRFASAHHVHPHPGKEAFEEGFRALVAELRPDAIFTMGTAVTAMLSKYRRQIERHAAILIPEAEAFEIASDKEATLRTCRRLGIACPRSPSLEEARRWLEASDGGPESAAVVVKPALDLGGATGVCFVRRPDDLSPALEACRRDFGGAVLQEWIPGSSTAMRTAQLLFDRSGRLAAWFTLRKIRQWPMTGGSTALGVSTADRELVESMLPFFEELGWIGPAEIELKVDPRDGKPKLIEVNPRFGGYFAFAAACGLDLTSWTVRLALGEDAPPEPPSYRSGLKYVSYARFAKTVVADLRSEPAGALGRARRDLRGPRAGNPSDLTDPLPRLGKQLIELRDWIRPKGEARALVRARVAREKD
jgi:predicted ATP-grasp superfamily ATP-dependent carboligase